MCEAFLGVLNCVITCLVAMVFCGCGGLTEVIKGVKFLKKAPFATTFTCLGLCRDNGEEGVWLIEGFKSVIWIAKGNCDGIPLRVGVLRAF